MKQVIETIRNFDAPTKDLIDVFSSDFSVTISKRRKTFLVKAVDDKVKKLVVVDFISRMFRLETHLQHGQTF